MNEILELELRSIISHRMLGYDCNMSKEDFDGMINDCAKIKTKTMTKEKQILEFPNTDMSFAFALDGLWTPKVLKVNEQLLADELVRLIEEEIEHWDGDFLQQGNDYNIIYDVDKEPFRFTVDLSFSVYSASGCVCPGKRVRINEVQILAGWGRNKEGIAIELPIKWCEETLRSMIELQILIN